MNILISYLGIKESGPVFTYELAKGMLANNENVYAILNDRIENKEKWIPLLGEERVFFASRWLSRKRPITSSLEFVGEAKMVKNFFADCTFDCTIRTFVDKYDDMFAKALKINKVINFCHDPVPHSDVSRREAEKTKKRINKADKIIVLTKEFIPIIRDGYNRRTSDIIFMRHGLLSYSNGQGIEGRERMIGREMQFLFFGRIDPYKGIDILLEAFFMLEQKYSNVKLIIAGSGDLSNVSGIISRLKNIQIINRYINDKEVDELFRKENIILVLPYKDATQSGVATVAFEYGVPIIASDTGGLKEQLFDGQAGILAKSGDANDLMAAMERFLTEKNLYDNEAAIVKKYRLELSWDKIACKLLNEVFA